MSDTFAELLPDKYWWYICDDPLQGLVPLWRGDDKCWIAKGFNGNYAYPATIEHTYTPRGGDNGWRVSALWWNYIRSINTMVGWEKLRINNGGWINYSRNKAYPSGVPYPDNPDLLPFVEGISSCWNIVKVLKYKNGSWLIDAFDFTKPPPDPNLVNPSTHPHLFCAPFTSIYKGKKGMAPQGVYTAFPIGTIHGECWIKEEYLNVGVDLPTEDPIMTNIRAYGVDVSDSWQTPYLEDGVDEGFPLDFVIQKAADGLSDWTDPTNRNYATWLIMYNSIKHFKRLGGYHFFQTEYSGKNQAAVAIKIVNRGHYVFWNVDYEQYLNKITLATALELKKYIIAFRTAHPNVRIQLYTNGWINTLLRSWLGNTFMDSVDLWYAGGPYYNVPLNAPLDDTIVPNIPNAFSMWQLSADGNQLADEFDFGTSETASIDLNLWNGTPDEMDVWLDLDPATLPEPPEPPNSDAIYDEAIGDAKVLLGKPLDVLLRST